MRLRAISGTCPVHPGEEFEAPENEGKVHVLLGTAEEVVEKVEPDERAELRAEYERVHGRKPFNGWGAEKLRDMVYGRRDMRAE